MLFSFDTGNGFCAVLLDLSKAFDFVDKKNFTRPVRILWTKE